MAEPLGTIIAGSGVLLAGLAYSVKAVWTLAINIRNGNSKDKKPCVEHGQKIVKLETETENFDTWRKEFDKRNTDEHTRIFDAINGK